MATAVTDLGRSLKLHPLTYLEEGDEVTVGRADITLTACSRWMARLC
jgi:hypothetical protein